MFKCLAKKAPKFWRSTIIVNTSKDLVRNMKVLLGTLTLTIPKKIVKVLKTIRKCLQICIDYRSFENPLKKKTILCVYIDPTKKKLIRFFFRLANFARFFFTSCT